jgi:hypothetical protein
LTTSQFRFLNGSAGFLLIVAPLVAFLNGVSFSLPSFLPFSPVVPIFARTGVNAAYADYAIITYAIFIALTYRAYVNARVEAFWSVLKDKPLQVQVDSRNDLFKLDIKGLLLAILTVGFLNLYIQISQRIELGSGAALIRLFSYLLFFLILLVLLRSEFSKRDQAKALTQRSEALIEHDASGGRTPVWSAFWRSQSTNRIESGTSGLSDSTQGYWRYPKPREHKLAETIGPANRSPSGEPEPLSSSGITIAKDDPDGLRHSRQKIEVRSGLTNRSIFRDPEPPSRAEIVFKDRRQYLAFLAIIFSIGSIFVTILFVSPFLMDRARTSVEEVEGVVVESHPPTGNCRMGARHNYNYGVITIKFRMSNGQDCTFTDKTCQALQAGEKVTVQPASWTYCGGTIVWRLNAPPLSSR